jgi:hypothetical protein
MNGRKQMSESEIEDYPQLLDWLRYFCAFMLYLYGISKLLHLQFNLQSQLALRPSGTLTGYQLTWLYFGYSRAYADLLGLTQILGGTLLLFRKTALLGAISMLPVMANILLINIFILVNDYGPFVISGILCICLLTLLWHQRSALASVFWRSQKSETTSSIKRHHWIRLAIVSVTLTMMIGGAYIDKRARRSREQGLHSSAAKSQH